jgi:hypothetical protein
MLWMEKRNGTALQGGIIMLKPDTNKKDWFLFHMTPLGMGLGAAAKETDRETSASTKIALIIVLGIVAVGLLLAAYLGT